MIWNFDIFLLLFSFVNFIFSLFEFFVDFFCTFHLFALGVSVYFAKVCSHFLLIHSTCANKPNRMESLHFLNKIEKRIEINEWTYGTRQPQSQETVRIWCEIKSNEKIECIRKIPRGCGYTHIHAWLFLTLPPSIFLVFD